MTHSGQVSFKGRELGVEDLAPMIEKIVSEVVSYAINESPPYVMINLADDVPRMFIVLDGISDLSNLVTVEEPLPAFFKALLKDYETEGGLDLENIKAATNLRNLLLETSSELTRLITTTNQRT